jgi:hypothetical protein
MQATAKLLAASYAPHRMEWHAGLCFCAVLVHCSCGIATVAVTAACAVAAGGCCEGAAASTAAVQATAELLAMSYARDRVAVADLEWHAGLCCRVCYSAALQEVQPIACAARPTCILCCWARHGVVRGLFL